MADAAVWRLPRERWVLVRSASGLEAAARPSDAWLTESLDAPAAHRSVDHPGHHGGGHPAIGYTPSLRTGLRHWGPSPSF